LSPLFQTNKLIFNDKDITAKLSTSNILKTLSFQDDLTLEQINLVKAYTNNKQWDKTTKTLSGVGALVVQAVVTYFTAGAGSAIVAGATQAAKQAAMSMVQKMLAAAIQSMVVQASTQVASAAITGSSLKLDVKSITTNAVKAGVLSLANNYVDQKLNIAKDNLSNQELALQTVSHTATQTAVYGGDFKDNLVTNVTKKIGDKAFKAVGDKSMDKELKGDKSFADGGYKKVLLHSATGAVVAKVQNKDMLAGAVSAGARELLSPMTQNNSEDAQQLASKIIGTLAGNAVAGDEGAQVGHDIALSAEVYNRQLHQDEMRFIKNTSKKYAKQNNISEEEAYNKLYKVAKYNNDKDTQNNITVQTQEQKDAGFIAVNGIDKKELEQVTQYLKEESKGKTIIDVYNGDIRTQNMFTSTKAQLENPYYNMSQSIGMEDNSFILFPTTPVATNTVKSVFNVGSTGYKEAKYQFLVNPVNITESIFDYGTSALPYGTPALSAWGAIGYTTGSVYDYEGTIKTINKGVDLIKSIPTKIEKNIFDIEDNSNGN
jgi:filamentous hemagglutinin